MSLYFNLLILTTTLGTSCQSPNYGQCTNPDGYSGSCVILNKCPELETIMDKPSLSALEIQFLIDSECRNIQVKEEPMICCISPKNPRNMQIKFHTTVTPKVNATTTGTMSATSPATSTISTSTLSTFTSSTTTSSTSTSSTTTSSTSTSSPSTTSAATSSTTTSSTVLPTSHLPEPGNCGVQSPLNRILGGDETAINTYRWMALLIYTRRNINEFGCGGSLINNRYVLTAAHCADPLRKNRKPFELTLVRLGEWDTRTAIDEEDGKQADEAIDVGIEKKIVHPQYNKRIRTAYNDIALLRLERYIEYTDFIQPICIHRNDDLLNKDISRLQMFASGWGVTENGTLSDIKLHVALMGKPLEQCQEKYNSIILQDTQLCAGGDKGIDTCNGDSGGPLVLYDFKSETPHYHIVGIISFGPVPCGKPDMPGVYTKVNKYFDWIESNLEL